MARAEEFLYEPMLERTEELSVYRCLPREHHGTVALNDT